MWHAGLVQRMVRTVGESKRWHVSDWFGKSICLNSSQIRLHGDLMLGKSNIHANFPRIFHTGQWFDVSVYKYKNFPIWTCHSSYCKWILQQKNSALSSNRLTRHRTYWFKSYFSLRIYAIRVRLKWQFQEMQRTSRHRRKWN